MWWREWLEKWKLFTFSTSWVGHLWEWICTSSSEANNNNSPPALGCGFISTNICVVEFQLHKLRPKILKGFSQYTYRLNGVRMSSTSPQQRMVLLILCSSRALAEIRSCWPWGRQSVSRCGVQQLGIYSSESPHTIHPLLSLAPWQMGWVGTRCEVIGF